MQYAKFMAVFVMLVLIISLLCGCAAPEYDNDTPQSVPSMVEPKLL